MEHDDTQHLFVKTFSYIYTSAAFTTSIYDNALLNYCVLLTSRFEGETSQSLDLAIEKNIAYNCSKRAKARVAERYPNRT